MKKVFLSILSIAVLQIVVVAQTPAFEGQIKFDIEYKQVPPEMEAMKAMLPKHTTVKIKGSNSRTETNSLMGSQAVLFNSEDKIGWSIMKMMGRKIAVKMNQDEIQSRVGNPDIKYFDESKEIAGYTCQKAEVTVTYEGQKTTSIVYYCTDIPNVGNQFIGLKGFPLEYSVKAQGLETDFTAKSVKKESIKDDEFVVPDDYEQTTMQDLMQMK